MIKMQNILAGSYPVSQNNNETVSVQEDDSIFSADDEVNLTSSIESETDYSDETPDLSFDINEEIDTFYQGKMGDCWLLSQLNSLSYTSEGQKIISDAITANDDGTYTVEFAGVGTSVTVSTDELKEARESGTFSKGDDDVLLLELAFEKVLELVKSGEITDVADCVLDTATYSEKSTIYGGYDGAVLSLLTGENVSTVRGSEISDVLNQVSENNDDYAVTICFGDKEGNVIYINDIYGNEIKCNSQGGAHGWSVKSVEDGVATIVNPLNSGKEYQVSVSEIEEYAYSIAYYQF